MSNLSNLKELNILYVEDELDVLEEIEDILELYVNKLFTATNGEEALKIYNSEDIDIIITDIQMPKMDGLTMIKKIRETNEHIPVVITTAFNEVSYLNQAIDLHVDKYITKPIELDHLLSALNRTAKVVYQQKEIENRDKVIKAILDKHPFYSIIVDQTNINKLHTDILSFLGFENSEDFSYHYNTNGDRCENYQNIEELISKITSVNSDLSNEIICLKHKNNKKIEYIVKIDFFEGTNLFLISFFEKNSINNELDSCFKHELCRSCKL